MGRYMDFANGLVKQGINLERIIKKCKKELVLDYSWISKVKTYRDGWKTRREEKRKNFITLYADSEEIGRVFLSEGFADETDIKKLLFDAYRSIKDNVKIPKKIKVNAYYHKYHSYLEKDLGKLQ
jgi:hypothetical protein